MSHHLDTPLARQNGQLYIDDLCVFQANGSTVFVMDVNSTITEPHVQPGFHPEARYEFKVHFDGAEFEDLTYRPSVNSATPQTKMRRRPSRSPSAAAVMMPAATVMPYAFTVHCSVGMPACKSCSIRGNAVTTTSASRMTMK
jgi:hypothetical protein